jgi:hypothetical protein
MAQQSPDYEFILVDMGIDRPTIQPLLAELNRDPRTARIPVAVTAEDHLFARAKQLVQREPLAMTVISVDEIRELEAGPAIGGDAPPKTDSSEVDVPTNVTARHETQAQSLLSLAARRLPPAEVRLRQAGQALVYMATMTDRSAQRLYDLRQHEGAILRALDVPTLCARATVVLSQIGSHRAQKSLVDLASQPARPAEMRRAAATAFARSVDRYGVQLTRDEIRQQYDRYNQSRLLDETTQRLLGSVLDAIEKPTKGKK